MIRLGAMYLQQRDAASLCRLGQRIAEEDECRHQAPVFARQAAGHEAEAALLRQQLAAARKLGLRGSAGTVPPNYFADAPSRVPQRSEERGEPGRSSDQSQIRNPQS